MLLELDIQLDENGNILKEDIIRLIPPFVYNYNLLVEKINAANNLETYLNFRLSKDSLYRAGVSECELYPSSEFQVNDVYFDYLPGYIPLSNNQKNTMREEHLKSLDLISKNTFDW